MSPLLLKHPEQVFYSRTEKLLLTLTPIWASVGVDVMWLRCADANPTADAAIALHPNFLTVPSDVGKVRGRGECGGWDIPKIQKIKGAI